MGNELPVKTYTRSQSEVPPGLWAGVCVQGGRGVGGGGGATLGEKWLFDKRGSISSY